MSRPERWRITCDVAGCTSAVVAPGPLAAAIDSARSLGWVCRMFKGKWFDRCPATHRGSR